ncbi:MAG: HIT domain-containing protein [Nitrososphaeria archaeon]|jgi:histidine triad (HIT) family protein
MSQDCVFCKISAGKEHAYKIFENENVIALLDRFPIAPGHSLVITKKHYPDFISVPDEELFDLARVSKIVGLAVKSGMNADGIRLFTNVGMAASQVIFHVHIHIVPMWEKEPNFTWFRRRAEITPNAANYILNKIKPYLNETLFRP